MNKTLVLQFSYDYNVKTHEVLDKDNHFTYFNYDERRRRFQEPDEVFLKIAVINSKILFTGRKDIIDYLKKKCEGFSSEWFFEADTIISLNEKIKEYGFTIDQVHEFYISEKKHVVDTKGLDIRRYNREEILNFIDDDRFDEAFIFDKKTPDAIGISCSMNDEIVGMAGASIDSPYMMQIGINMDEEYKNTGLGTKLVSLIRNEIIDMGYLPYCGTSMSHLASKRVMLSSNFKPTWVELTTKRIE